jgi:hypothetical protein
MSRLITFGCSYTYGDRLPDCYQPEKDASGMLASKLAWPQLLANELELDCVNNSKPGVSNKFIWNSIINFNYKKNDIVVILWTHPDRTTLITKETTTNIGPWDTRAPGSEYYKYLYDDHDSELTSKLFISHANYFLKNKLMTVYNLIINRSLIKLFNMTNSDIVDHIPLYFIDKIYNDIPPKALDNVHPGINAHLKFSQDLLNYITTKCK